MDVITEIMRLFDEEYKGKFIISPERIKLWRALLADIHPEIVMTAAVHLVSLRTEWPPNIGQLRDKALALQAGELAPPSAHEAWAHVQARIQSDDAPLTELERQTLKQVGTVYDMRRSGNPAADRAQFLKAFEQAIEKRRLERATLPTVKMIAEQCERALPEARPTVGEVEELIGEPIDSAMVKAFLKGTGLVNE
jgi:hypothetical protein